MTTTTPDKRAGAPTAVLAGYLAYRASRLQEALLDRAHREHSTTLAHLARLRRAEIGDPSDPALWGVAFEGFPEKLVGRGDDPNRAERAAHAALVLLAIHLQSAREPRHLQGRRLGLAVADLARHSARQTDANLHDSASVQRLRRFATATSWAHGLTHLRGLIQLMRAEGVALDYGDLAKGRDRIQTPSGLRVARLQWGRDIHATPSKNKSDTEEN